MYSHQVSDLPEARAVVTQYDRHEVDVQVQSAACRGRPAEAGDGAPGTVTYGPEFHAWAVFLMVMHHVPIRAVRGHYRLHVRQPPFGRVGAPACWLAQTKAVAAANEIDGGRSIAPAHVCVAWRQTHPSGAGRPESARFAYSRLHRPLLTCSSSGGRDLPWDTDLVSGALHGTVVAHDRYVDYDIRSRALRSAGLSRA